MVVNAAGLYAQPLARNLQGLPQKAIPDHWFARGHYCTMEGRGTVLHFQLAAWLVHGGVDEML